ncbi:MAG: hypothetical protein AUJ12_08955 [Alphaproteobacteria bacterium CG1_02_46_17]|nr:MAG: hypothetical protein AUJ12_08955 [Alphaproteobacteria bacterium CG1_02_46_17]
MSSSNKINPILQLAFDSDPEAPRRLRYLLMTTQANSLASHATDTLVNFFQTPEKFKFPDKTVSALFEHCLSPTGFFRKFGDSIEPPTIWGICSHDARPETAKAAAILIAERIRCLDLPKQTEHFIDLCEPKDHFSFDMTGLFGDKKLSAKNSFDEHAFKSSVLMIQNALVDLVKESAQSNRLISGAEVLSILRDEGEGTKFWSKKLHDIKAKQVMSLKHGDKTIYQMVFEP